MSRRRIAIVGAGISGLVAAYVLARMHDVTVFEAAPRAGGHTNTIDVRVEGSVHHVDTGFIVFNERNYPGFSELLRQLDVPSQPTDMSFSVQCATTELEYRGSSLSTFFAQRANLVRLRHWALLREILRFNKEAPRVLAQAEDTTMLRDHLAQRGYSDDLRDHYIVPMAAALWSADPETVLDFPAHYFIRFFENHGFFKLEGRPTWRVVRGGSQRYVERLIASLSGVCRTGWLRTGTPVQAIRRCDQTVEVRTDAHGTETFDGVILAVHSDQALALLEDASEAERSVLADVAYQPNEAVLHSDPSVMPRERRAWSSWNYHLPREGTGAATVTYWMNMLQTLPEDPPFFVSLNRTADIDPALVHRTISYGHPVYDPAARKAQLRWSEVNGVQNTWFCGAWWGWGFHEDGVQSALRVCDAFGATL